MPRILIHDYAGHPFQVQLSRSLAKRGHDILHLYSASTQTPHGALSLTKEDPSNLKIEGVKLKEQIQKYSFLKRRQQEKEYGELLVKRVLKFNPDILISGNTPLDPQSTLLKHCRKNRIKFVFWLQDVYGLAIYEILKKKMALLGALIGRYYIRLERTLLKKSDGVVVISQDFSNLLHHWGVEPAKVDVIQNWAPLDEMPLRPKKNHWSGKYQLDQKICLIYSGTLGMKHNPDLLLQLAQSFKTNDQIRVVVISEGAGANWLREKKNEFKLNNLIIMDYQPFEELPNVLGSADILLAILNSDAGIYSVPSKVLSYLCAARPILMAVPDKNLSAKIVAESGSGIVVSPDDAQAFISGAKRLVEDQALRLRMGQVARNYAEKTFDIRRITECFEQSFRKSIEFQKN